MVTRSKQVVIHMSVDYILSTKLVIPESPPHIIERPRLMLPKEPARITLVCAPAGYGKTTLISSWARTNTLPTAWLSLDSSDNDPTQFLMHLISAIQTQCPDFAQATATTLASKQLPSITGLTRSLLNELCGLPEHICLMLDDLHYIDNSSIHEALAFMVEHLPTQLSLVIASRNTLPFSLSRLRAQRQITEFNTEDLRFNRQEVAQFCNDAMQLGLSEPLIDTLEARTEGWIVGLQLAALSLHNAPNKQAFINTFAGDDRHITDFLIDEVLRHLPEESQNFLLHTCLLPQLSAPLCDAVRQQHNSRSIIDELERTNMFITRLDHKRVWYRYHHLFASLLKTRLYDLQPELMTTLHHRASVWFKEHGLFNDAIQQGIKAGDYEFAAALMEENSSELFSLGQFTTALIWAYQLPSELLAKHPKLSMLCAWAGLVMDNVPEVERHVRAATIHLERYRDAPSGSKERALFGQLMLISSCQFCLAGDVERAQASVMDALGSLTPGRVLYRGASICLGFCYYAQGELDKALRLFEENAEIADARNNLLVPIFATMGLARSHFLRGQLTTAQAVYQKALHDCELLGWQDIPACGMLYIGLGELAFESNDLLNAKQMLTKGISMTTAGQMQYINAWGRVLLAQTQLALGETTMPLTIAAEAALLRYSGRFVVEIPPLSATLAQLWLSQGRMEAIQHWLKAAQLPMNGSFAVEREAEYMALARYWVMTHQFADAAALLNRLWAHAESHHHVRVMVEIQILKTLILQAEGETAKALATLQHAVVLAGDNQLVRLFSRDSAVLSPLLHKLAHDLSQHPLMPALLGATGTTMPNLSMAFNHSTISVLSKKERQVARHLLTGATSQEIAENMCVSLSTIKTHTKNIYAKLGVNKRLQAIEALLKLNLA